MYNKPPTFKLAFYDSLKKPRHWAGKPFFQFYLLIFASFFLSLKSKNSRQKTAE
jgi:hypothetical protein